jgi:hypothetical protein
MLDTSGSSKRAESPKVGERQPLGDRGIPVINPPLVALGLAIAVLVALLVVVLLRRDPTDTANHASRPLGVTQSQPVAGTADAQYNRVGVLYRAPMA